VIGRTGPLRPVAETSRSMKVSAKKRPVITFSLHRPRLLESMHAAWSCDMKSRALQSAVTSFVLETGVRQVQAGRPKLQISGITVFERPRESPRLPVW
jgi:hypothetical protein